MQYAANFRNYLERFRKRLVGNNKRLSGTNGVTNTLFSLKSARNDEDHNVDRYEPCHVLWKKGVTAVIWLEDLLALHTSKIRLQDEDLHLLVREPQEAAKIMRSAGYEDVATKAKLQREPEFDDRGIRMALPLADTGVILLPAQDWYYNLDEGMEGFLPPLRDYLDSMMEFWLRMSSQEYNDRILFSLYIGRLISGCYKHQDEEGDIVKDPAYAEKLQPAHRELHYNIVQDDPDESFVISKRHQYHVRRSQEIRDGLFSPQPYRKGVYRPDLTTLVE